MQKTLNPRFEFQALLSLSAPLPGLVDVELVIASSWSASPGGSTRATPVGRIEVIPRVAMRSLVAARARERAPVALLQLLRLLSKPDALRPGVAAAF